MRGGGGGGGGGGGEIQTSLFCSEAYKTPRRDVAAFTITAHTLIFSIVPTLQTLLKHIPGPSTLCIDKQVPACILIMTV